MSKSDWDEIIQDCRATDWTVPVPKRQPQSEPPIEEEEIPPGQPHPEGDAAAQQPAKAKGKSIATTKMRNSLLYIIWYRLRVHDRTLGSGRTYPSPPYYGELLAAFSRTGLA
jgi:hypothetical protein